MPATMITIRFIRKADANLPKSGASRDDLVHIQRSSAGFYEVRYKEGNGDVNERFEFNDRNTFRYVRNLFGLIQWDADPFVSVQVDLPGFPSVLIDTRDLTLARERLLDSVEFFLDATHTSLNKKRVIPDDDSTDNEEEDAMSTDSDETESVDSEAEYVDMPPLIPAGGAAVEGHGRHHLFFE